MLPLRKLQQRGRSWLKGLQPSLRQGSKDQAPKDSRSAESNGAWGLWVLLSRLVMLSVSISLGWGFGGVLVARYCRPVIPNPPVQEVAMRRTSQTWRKLQRFTPVVAGRGY